MLSRFEAAVELRLSEKRTGQTQDFVRLAQFAHFSLQRLDTFFFSCCEPWSLPGIAFLLAYPAARRLWRAADLGRNRCDGRPLRFVLAGSLAGHPHSALVNFRGILWLLFYSPIFSKNGASFKLGAIQLARGCGIVTVRQWPETAGGVIFLTLDDEFGTINIIVWPSLAGKRRRELMSAQLLGVYGIWQSKQGVRNLIAKRLVDCSHLLGELSTQSRNFH